MRTWYLVVSVALSAFVCCGTVQAQGDDGRQGQERPPGDLVRQLRQRLLERFDENGNGRLDRREGRHAIEVLRGVVERHRGRLIHLSTLPAGLRSILALFDRNKDGVLDPMEMRILKRALPRVTRPPQRPDRPGAEDERPDRPERLPPPVEILDRHPSPRNWFIACDSCFCGPLTGTTTSDSIFPNVATHTPPWRGSWPGTGAGRSRSSPLRRICEESWPCLIEIGTGNWDRSSGSCCTGHCTSC